MLRSGCARDDIIRVMVRLDDGFLIISVHLPGEPSRAADNSESAGFGLKIVEHLAERWGAESPNARHVWAALPVGSA